MDRKEGLVTVEDTIRKLKRMDAKGKVWSQDVLLRVTDREIQIVDEMTQGELENFNLTDITLLSAEENQCNYNSVLVIKFRLSGQKNPQMYLFQCDRKSVRRLFIFQFLLFMVVLFLNILTRVVASKFSVPGSF